MLSFPGFKRKCFLKFFSFPLVKKPKVCISRSSHRKHCSLNASSVVPPLTPWLLDIALHHTTSPALHNLCLVTLTVSRKQDTDMGGGRWWLRCGWADQSERTGYLGGGPCKKKLKKKTKTQNLSPATTSDCNTTVVNTNPRFMLQYYQMQCQMS